MLGSVSEVLDAELLADLSVLASDLLDLVRQFPNYRAFVDEAASTVGISDGQRETLLELLTIVEGQDNSIVDQSLKVAIDDVRSAASNVDDPASGLALVRTASNVVRAVARSVNRHASAVWKKTGETFDNVGGKFLGGTLVAVLLGAPTLGLLLYLQTALPSEFGFVSALVRLAKLLVG